jgi:dipeptidyl aminopeptidase/acylaminoacyl peptidase
MLGVTDPTDGLEGECGDLQYSSSVQAVVSLAAPTEMRTPGDIRLYSVRLLGGTPEEVPELYTKASPLTYVGNDDPPVLIIHSDKDNAVPLNNAELLNAKMNEVESVHTFIIKGSGHFIPVDNDVWDFLDKYLK